MDEKKKGGPYKPNHSNKKWKKDVDKKSEPEQAGEKKLTKQEKRNLKKKQQHLNNTQNITPTPTQNSSVYKRIPVYPNSYKLQKPQNRLIDASHPEFDDIVKTSYEGFSIENSDAFSPEFNEQFQTALREFDGMGYYQFDMTQPAGLGTKVARTFVTRCLVGDPGITYKYLGIRMFAHPWVAGAEGANKTSITIGKLNHTLAEHAEELNKKSGKAEYGSSQFNLTLINRCYPVGQEVSLKLEPMYEKDKLTVSWHADSSLDHFSTIAVYHFNEEPNLAANANANGNKTKQPKPWKAALRVQGNAEGPQQGKPLADGRVVEAPALVVPLPSACCYYLLDDFNHHHQHSGKLK